MSVTNKQLSAAETDSERADQDRELTAEEQRQRQIELNQPIIALLQSWREEDLAGEGDDDGSLEEFMRGIDANRIPGSKLFEKYYS